MKVSLTWLKQYLKTEASVAEIADKLTAIGLEVEEVTDAGKQLAPFIVGEIKTKEKHPNADKLNLLGVFTGQEMLQIVCGAPNCYVGMKSALARPGDLIPQYGEKLEKGVIRGVESHGMLCSAKELGIGEDHTGIVDLKTDLPAGTPLTAVLKPDVVLDVNVTPDRGDCFSIKGIARDLAAADMGVLIDEQPGQIPGKFPSPIAVQLADEACPQFAGRLIRGVKNVASPAWLQERLLAVGLRPISALVDITNYLNIGAGRPLHVFDADLVKGDLTVRSARAGEKLQALDGKEYALQEGMLVIADEAGPQSIAGIMGGAATGCSENTANVFVESAYFLPSSIVKTGRVLNVDSDSRVRFEHGVDPAGAVAGNELATRLILEICGGEPSELVCAGAEPAWQHAIAFDFGKIKRLCGLDVPLPKARGILEKLGFHVESNTVSVPSWRVYDVRQDVDLIEEVVRIYGLETLPEEVMRSEKIATSTLLPRQRREVAVRRALAARGLNQAMTWSFMDSRLARYFDSKGIRLANPIASDLDEMRPSLVPNLLSAVKRNQSKGIADVQLFEVGPAFYGAAPNEQQLVACGVRAGAFSPRHHAEPTRSADVFDAKADALEALASMEAPASLQAAKGAPSWYHPGRSGSLKLGKTVLACFGEIHPTLLKVWDIKTPVVAFEVFLDNLPALKPRATKAQKPLKTFSQVPLTRDFAFVMDQSVSAGQVIAAIQNADKTQITDVSVFDVYAGDKLQAGQKSLAVQVTLQPQEKTLTDAEIEVLSAQIVNNVRKSTGAVLRTA